MKVLVITQDSQIRDALVTQFGIRNRSFVCVDDDCSAIHHDVLMIPPDIDIVVNALSVDELQRPSVLERVEQLASACARAKIVLIQLSGSQVFDGLVGGRHREEDAADDSGSCIGTSLLRVEHIIAESCPRHIILRTGLFFSAVGSNVLTVLLNRFKVQKPLLLSSVGNTCPIHTSDLARVISGLIDQVSCGGKAWGIYHYHSSDAASHFKFAETVLAAVSQFDDRLAEGVDLVSVDEVDAAWSQPLLNCEKILNTFGIKQLPWRSYVMPSVKQIINPQIDE